MDEIAKRLDTALRVRYYNISAVGVGSDRLYVYYYPSASKEQKDLFSEFEGIVVEWKYARFKPASP